MIVEDDTFILEDLVAILGRETEGYRLVTAANGKQGLHKFEEFRPLIVVTDVRMPAMDGLEMMARIKKQDPYVQFLILSAYDDFSSVQAALRQGARDYLLKQENTPELLTEKLAAIRESLSEQVSIALNAVKNRLYELIVSPAEDPRILQEQLEGILRLGGYFPDELLLAPARQFALRLMGERGMVVPGPEQGQEAPGPFSICCGSTWPDWGKALSTCDPVGWRPRNRRRCPRPRHIWRAISRTRT